MTAPARCCHGRRVEHCPPCSTRALLVELQKTVDQLAANLLPGTARPWTPPQFSAARRAELDREAREDRLHIAQQGDLPTYLRDQAVVVPPGESAAPYDLDVADLLTEVLTTMEALTVRAEAVLVGDLTAWAGGWARHVQDRRLAPAGATGSLSNPRPLLTFLTDHVDLLGRLDPGLLEEIADAAHSLINRAASPLGLISDGQLLAALCPWCDGKTAAHPVGGAPTLRIRTLPGGRPVIVCEGGHCTAEPGTAECGIGWRGLPAWDLENEGEWLAKAIEIAAARRAAKPLSA